MQVGGVIMIIGITGKSGSGKTTIASLIKKLDNRFKVIHIDEIGHDVVTYPDVKEQMIQAFGYTIINEQGQIDRKKVGDLVFNNRHEMAKLADITWHYMEQVIDEEIRNNDFVILDWILLPSTKYLEKCDIKILVDVSYEIRKEKAMTRDNITEEKFKERENASIEYDEKMFDYIIENDFNIESSEKKVSDVYVKSIISR
jgi:dephospho-CoA kinase